MSDGTKARAILNAAAIFQQGCGNTAVPASSPESCDECSEHFVDVVSRILAGEIETVLYVGPDLHADHELH